METTSGSRAEATEEPGWLGIEEASPFTGKKVTNKVVADAKRWSSVMNATLVVLIMMMPPIILIAGRFGAPTVWIKSTVTSSGTRDREGNNPIIVAALFS